MAERKRIARKLPEFRIPKPEASAEEMDLKKVRAQMLKDLEDKEKNANDWYDKEMEKNLKNP